MSFLMQFLAWVACVVVGTSLFVAVVSLYDLRFTWDWPRLSSLRCPECGGKYDLRLIKYTYLPPEDAVGDTPTEGKPPARARKGPSEWEVKCSSCGLYVVYVRLGKLKRTFRPPPPDAPSAS